MQWALLWALQPTTVPAAHRHIIPRFVRRSIDADRCLRQSYPPVVNGAATAISLLVAALRERHQVFVYAPRYPGHPDHDPEVRRFSSYRLPPEPVPDCPPVFVQALPRF